MAAGLRGPNRHLYGQLVTPPHSTSPLHVRLADTLRERIRSGAWPAGSSLPSEAELGQEFGASRGTVRAAVQALRAEGLVVGGRGRPPVIRNAPPAQSFSSFLSFTRWAESMGRVPGQRTLEVARRPSDDETAAALGLGPGQPVVQVLRQRLLDGAPCLVERTSFTLEAGSALFGFDADSGSIFQFLIDQGVDLYRGQHVIDAVGADATDADLLGVRPGAPLLRVRRTTSSREGAPLEFSDDRYLPGLANFTIENTMDAAPALVRVQTVEGTAS